MNSHLADIANLSQTAVSSSDACIWVPTNRLVVHQVPAPSAPRRKWAELVPWMLEDKLLQAPEEMHFVIAGKSKEALSVFVIDKNQIREWKESIEALGLNSFQLIPDFMALPWHSGIVSIGKSDEYVLIRTGELEGFSVPAELAWHMLADVLDRSDKPLRLSLSLPLDELPEELKDKVEIQHQEVDWQNASVPKNANLLIDEFALAPSSNSLVPWLKTAALFVLALILSFAAVNQANNSLEVEIASLDEQNRSAFYSLFPGLTIRSGDIRSTLELYISNRFRQRESLESEVMQALTLVDSAMSTCNCDLQSLTWSNNKLNLILPQSVLNVIEQWEFEGYVTQINTEDEGNLSLTLNQEYGR